MTMFGLGLVQVESEGGHGAALASVIGTGDMVTYDDDDEPETDEETEVDEADE